MRHQIRASPSRALEGERVGSSRHPGVAAADLVLSRPRRGDLVVAPDDCDGGTYRVFATQRERDQFEVAFIDLGRLTRNPNYARWRSNGKDAPG